MLNEIYKTLKEHQGEPLPNKLHDKVPNKVPNKIPNKLRRQYPDLSDAVWDVYMELKEDAYASAETVGGRLGISIMLLTRVAANIHKYILFIIVSCFCLQI